MWKLGVADNGIGIDEQYHEQVFGLFKRLHGSSKYAGSGMGLAICHKIVDRHGVVCGSNRKPAKVPNSSSRFPASRLISPGRPGPLCQ
jgi:light-regulated signal transduction histidine kinase (bacteriophytochrome)